MNPTDIDTLRARLREIAAIPYARWTGDLPERKREELAFHDRDRDRSRMESLDRKDFDRYYGNRKYYAGTARSRAYVDTWIAAHAGGRVFLDYACGNGGYAIRAARAGAALSVGIDLSPVSIENARRDAEEQALSDSTFFVVADAENTLLPESSIDVVICSGMLHHLDLSYAFPELRRILKPGGRILAVEALDYNPAIKLYRFLTPQMRTEWEKRHILTLKDLAFAERFFAVGEVRYWHIASILGAYFPRALPALDAVDRLLTRLPLVKRMAWTFTFELIKRDGG